MKAAPGILIRQHPINLVQVEGGRVLYSVFSM